MYTLLLLLLTHLHSNRVANRPLWQRHLGIDLLFMADHSMYEAFVELMNEDSVAAEHYIHSYVSTIFEQLRVLVAGFPVDGGPLRLSLAGVFIASRRVDCPIRQPPVRDESEEEEEEKEGASGNRTTEDFVDDEWSNSTSMSLSIHAAEALARLTTWLRRHDSLLPQHDHAILLTKHDLLTAAGESATQGIAYVRMMCKPGDSSSVVEDVGGMATAVIAAHELAHSLGALHDGGGETAECPAADNFLMSPSTAAGARLANAFRLSPCSAARIGNFTKHAASWCIHKRSSATRAAEDASRPAPPPSSLTRAQLCQIAFAPHYSTCPTPWLYSSSSQCGQLWCKDRRLRRRAPCETKPFLPSLDGDHCGFGMWCQRGECVVNTSSQSECRDVNVKVCMQYSASKRKYYCKNFEFSQICCATCLAIENDL